MEIEHSISKTESHILTSFRIDGSIAKCKVIGPIEMQPGSGKPMIDIRWTEPTILNPKIFEKYYSKTIKDILSKFVMVEMLHSKFIMIELYLVSSDNKALCCALNAVCLGLVTAGIPLKGMFYGSHNSSYEDIFVYFNDKLVISHCFGKISSDDMNSKKIHENYIEVKENVDYCLSSINVSSFCKE